MQQSVSVQITNNGTPQQASATTNMTPQGMVVSIILDDLNRSGPISKTMKNKLGGR